MWSCKNLYGILVITKDKLWSKSHEDENYYVKSRLTPYTDWEKANSLPIAVAAEFAGWKDKENKSTNQKLSEAF